MDLQLKDDVAAVIGGAAGIGLAIAKAFAQEGAAVAIVDRSSETPSFAREITTAPPGRSLGVVGDVADLDALVKANQTILDHFGRCDHVVYAAGIGSGQRGFPFWNVDPTVWARILDINLTGAVRAAHAFRDSLIASPHGVMTLIASVAGQIGSQTDPPYSASKAGLINFGQCAARDFAPFGVRVNILNPGMVKTALNQATYEAWLVQQPRGTTTTYDEWAAEKIRQLVPLNRWQDPEDIAAMAVFLASRRAKNVTGQTINVDGGFVMHW